MKATDALSPTKNAMDGYDDFFREIKGRVKATQVRAALALSREVVLVYWQIGRDIREKQERHGWGAKVVLRLADDLKNAFPGVEGFSRTNLLYMRAFAEAYPDLEIVHQLVDNFTLPWRHYVSILDKVKDTKERAWYIRTAHEHGWSRPILEHQIEINLYGRQGKAQTNFTRTLPPLDSDLAQQVLKDPYNFDFLTLGTDAQERDLERGLLEKIRDFLLELGAGFAFVGSQYHLTVGNDNYYLDLLFYHLNLRCYVVLDLKMGKFIPEHAGKMNFYLSAVDDRLRHPNDGPTIGLILCKSRDSITVEYALRNTNTPIGVAAFRFQDIDVLPADLEGNLPTVAQIESQLTAALRDEKEDESYDVSAEQKGFSEAISPEVTELPGGWRIAKLGDLCNRPDYGLTASATTTNTGVRFLRITDIQEGAVDWRTVPFCTATDSEVVANELSTGDLVVARIGATTGKAYLIRECPPQTVFASYLIRLRSSGTAVPEYLACFFQTPAYWQQIDQNKGGTLKGGVSIPILQNLAVPLPPFPEQKAIAATLRAVQEARDARRRELAAERERKVALMGDLFTSGVRGETIKETEIGPLPQSWDVLALGAVALQAQYGLSIRGEPQGQYPILRMNCLKDGAVSFRSLQYVNLSDAQFQAFRVRRGDLLFNRTNSADLVGKSGIFDSDRESVFASYLVRIVLDEKRASPGFVNYYLNFAPTLARLRSMASRGVSQANINASKLKALVVPLPSLDEQKDVADIFAACDDKIAALEAEIALHDELFRSLLDELLSGRILTHPLIADNAATEGDQR